MRRGYYLNNNIHEVGRIQPIQGDEFYQGWNSFERIEKIAWLWNETNLFIENFFKTIPQENYFQFNFNELNKNSVKGLLDFLEIGDIPLEAVANTIKKPTNVQSTGSFPQGSEWSQEEKQKVINILVLKGIWIPF